MTSTARGRGATAMRIAAAVWLVGAVIGVALELWQQSIWDEREAGAEIDAILARIRISSWMSYATHAVSSATVAIAASAWARGRPLVRVGQGLLALSVLVGVWLLMVRTSQSTTAELESLGHVATANAVVFFVGLAGLLVPLRAPLVARVGFALLAAAWLVYLHVIFEPGESDPPTWLFSVMSLMLASCWSAGVWLAATHEIDVVVDGAAGAGVDDPSRLRAADGVALLRVGMIARIVLTIGQVAMLVAVRDDPGAASMVVWLGALGHCVLAVVLATAMTRYGSLPDRAIERGHITTVVACLAIAAMLELDGASQAAALLDVLGHANDGDLWGMPRLTELEAMQARAQWTSRFATLVGIVAAVSLAISLRATALWQDDYASGDRASTLVVTTILGGGGAGVLAAIAQSGAITDFGAIVAAMLAALTLAVVILVMWLRLLGSVTDGLRRVPPPTPST